MSRPQYRVPPLTPVEAMEVLSRALAPDVIEALEALIDQRVADRIEEVAQLGDGQPELLSYAQAARLLDCSPDAVRMRAKRGRLDVRYHGRRAYVTRESVNRLEGWG